MWNRRSIPIYFTNMVKDVAIETYLFDQYFQRNLYNNLLFLRQSCELRIDTYFFDQYDENNRSNKLLFLDGMGVKLSIDIYIFDG